MGHEVIAGLLPGALYLLVKLLVLLSGNKVGHPDLAPFIHLPYAPEDFFMSKPRIYQFFDKYIPRILLKEPEKEWHSIKAVNIDELLDKLKQIINIIMSG